MYEKRPYFHIDPPHSNIKYEHINLEDFTGNSNAIYDCLQKKYNHYPLTDDAYAALHDIGTIGKKVEVAGKVLLIAGIALDALELGLTIQEDLTDEDKKLGKKTTSTAVSIAGSWTGGLAGAKLGALLGAATGPLAPAAIPILSLAFGIVGAYGGSKIGEWVIDVTQADS